MSGAGRGYRWEDPGREADRRADAREVAAAVWRDPCFGLVRVELESALGWGPRRFEQAVFYAWRCGWVQFIGPYLVAPPEAAGHFGGGVRPDVSAGQASPGGVVALPGLEATAPGAAKQPVRRRRAR